jgi:hypothetical protein
MSVSGGPVIGPHPVPGMPRDSVFHGDFAVRFVTGPATSLSIGLRAATNRGAPESEARREPRRVDAVVQTGLNNRVPSQGQTARSPNR